MLMSLVRNRVYSVQTHALFQNLHAKYSIFKKIFNFSSNLKFFWMLLFWVLYTYVVYKITNKQLVTKLSKVIIRPLSQYLRIAIICFAQTIKYRDIFRIPDVIRIQFHRIQYIRFGVRIFYCRVRVSQARVRVRSGFRSMPFNNIQQHMRAICTSKNKSRLI